VNSWGLRAIPIGLGGFWVTSGIGTVVAVGVKQGPVID